MEVGEKEKREGRGSFLLIDSHHIFVM